MRERCSRTGRQVIYGIRRWWRKKIEVVDVGAQHSGLVRESSTTRTKEVLVACLVGNNM